MTMATYSKKRVSKMSSKSKKDTNKGKHATLTQVKEKVPLPKSHDLFEVVTADISNTELCKNGDGNSCYEVLEALGLKRTAEITVVADKKVSRSDSRNNNNLELANKNVPQDKNNNTKVSAVKLRNRSCTKCNLSFKSVSKPSQHKILYCKICSKMFRNSDLLLKHKKCHSGEQPYCCLQCNATFSTLPSLTAHMRQHAGKSPYTCKVCKIGFEAYSDYLDHEPVHLLRKLKHPKLKLFKCVTCSRDFGKLCDLERHMRVHTGEKPYVCKICKNRFQQAHNLTKHMIIHTKEKLFKCDICSKQFGRSDVLTRHMITHSVNKPHPCQICEKSFGRFSQLVDHVKKHHSDCDANM